MRFEEIVWLIMTLDNKMVAKGTPRNRWLVPINEDDKKRFLTYTSKKKAEAAFNGYGFYGGYGKKLKAVKYKMIIEPEKEKS